MKAIPKNPAFLLLDDGTRFEGVSVGATGTSGGEICFNTGMTGYQEIYTDPSYHGQIIVTTTSHIGNYGVFAEDEESDQVQVQGVVINAFSDVFSRNTGESSLQAYLEKNGIVGIADIDTRKLVRHIRSKGAMNGIISSELSDEQQLSKALSEIPNMEGLELASTVSTKKAYLLGDESGASFKVAVLDLGCKRNILKSLTQRGALCKVFPAKTPATEILAWEPDGFFVSNGPGDPAVMPYAIETMKTFVATDKPVFGICLGHQILAEACGISTFKMHHGHRGINHPVKNLVTGLSEVTSQNHGFAIDSASLEASDTVAVTHINLNDNSIEGIKVKGKPAFSVQHHPESNPGPHDSKYLFDDFIKLILKHKI